MQIEIVTIGDELLSGDVVDTNASLIGKHLARAGYEVSRHTTLPDNLKFLKNGLAEVLSRQKPVICCGGLGPTVDDCTREVIADLFDTELVTDPALLEKLNSRFVPSPAIANQAKVPQTAELLPNNFGVAPGLAIGRLLALPGVPQELKPMLDDYAIPYLQKNFPSANKIVSLTLNFASPESEIDPYIRDIKSKYPQTKFGIYPSYGIAAVKLVGKSKTELEVVAASLKAKFPSFESADGKIETAVAEQLIASGQTLGVVEVGSGGALCARLTHLNHSFFCGGLVGSRDMVGSVLGLHADSTIKEISAAALDFIPADYNLTLILRDGTIQTAINDGTDINCWDFPSPGPREVSVIRGVNKSLGKLLLKRGE